MSIRRIRRTRKSGVAATETTPTIAATRIVVGEMWTSIPTSGSVVVASEVEHPLEERHATDDTDDRRDHADDGTLLDDDADDRAHREPEGPHRGVLAPALLDGDPAGVEGDQQREGEHGDGRDHEEAGELLERGVEPLADAADRLTGGDALEREDLALQVGRVASSAGYASRMLTRPSRPNRPDWARSM